MLRRSLVVFAVVACVAFLFAGCAKNKKIVEGGGEEGKVGVAEGGGAKAGKIEGELHAKKYPGIEGEVIESSMLKDIHFAFDRYDLSEEARATLAKNAEFMKKSPQARIQIEGHCDERGTAEYNLALGERRANSAKQYLISLGVPASQLSTISYGEEMPLDPGHNEEAWAKNRRDHFVILSK
jgi:peptidoglycan-associated lipoprotein